jgi:hypothetical protein
MWRKVAIQPSNPDSGRTRQSPVCIDALEFRIVSLIGPSDLMALQRKARLPSYRIVTFTLLGSHRYCLESQRFRRGHSARHWDRMPGGRYDPTHRWMRQRLHPWHLPRRVKDPGTRPPLPGLDSPPSQETVRRAWRSCERNDIEIF